MAQTKTSKIIISSAIAVIVAGISIATITNAQNSSSPVQVTANEIDVQPATNSAVFTGNAEVVQNNVVMRSNRFRVTYGAEGTANAGQIQRVITESETFLTSPTERIRGDRAEYDAATNTAIFYGHVILTQGQSVATGDELRVNTVTHAAFMKSNTGRVKAVFFPNSAPK